jgi:uncharacterized membrane protein
MDVANGWVKTFHTIAVIACMAGILYLSRLFVYHCAAEKGCPIGTFKAAPDHSRAPLEAALWDG